MTPGPALWNGRSRGPESGGTSKKRRKKGSSSRGFWGPFSWMVPRVAMFTTAGETFLIIGDSEGTCISPTTAGKAAVAGAAAGSRTRAARARSIRFMVGFPAGYAGFSPGNGAASLAGQRVAINSSGGEDLRGFLAVACGLRTRRAPVGNLCLTCELPGHNILGLASPAPAPAAAKICAFRTAHILVTL